MVGVVTLTALSVMNALLIAGPRTTYAAARDLATEWHLARWNHARGTPTGAVLATAAVALLLVAFGDLTRGGFSTMVDYLSPVYWFFTTLSGLAVIVLRWREPDAHRRRDRHRRHAPREVTALQSTSTRDGRAASTCAAKRVPGTSFP